MTDADDGRLVRDATRYSSALEDPATDAALRRLRKRGTRTVLVALAAFVVTLVIIGLVADDDGNIDGFLGFVPFLSFVMSPLAVCFGIAGWINTAIAKRILRQNPWRPYGVKLRHVVFNNGAPALVFDGDLEGEAFFLSGTIFRAKELPEYDGPMLVCGESRSTRVVAMPDRNIVRVARRTMRSHIRRRSLEYAAQTPPTT